MTPAAIYFGIAGPVAVCLGVALLVDFRGLGKRYENDLNNSAANVVKAFRLPWPPNPYWGPTYRPFAGVFFVLLGVAMFAGVLTGSIR
jgi:hypothetical protein